VSSRRLGSRAESARATRLRIIDAARRLFIEQGYLDTTMTAVAEEAGVALQTIYLSVGSKAQLLNATIDATVDDEGTAALVQSSIQYLRDLPDGRSTLSLCAHQARKIFEDLAPLIARMLEAAADADVAQIVKEARERNLATFRSFALFVVEKPGFDTSLGLDHAVDVMYALLSFDTYRVLCMERGWDGRQWEDWITGALTSSLFPGS
jgi:AcrR family transcriptional regulator